MRQSIIQDMVEALQPVLSDQERAERILSRFWQDQIALVWTTQDVHRAANECSIALTERQARELLFNLHEHHNPKLGLQWKDLKDYARSYDRGRSMKRREIELFVKHNILAVNKAH